MILSIALGIIINTVAIPSMSRERVVRNKQFKITYVNGTGGSDTLYFQDLQSGAAAMEMVFKNCKNSIGDIFDIRRKYPSR